MLWYAVLQVFNPNSPSILYGLVGLRLYFFYLPLMFIGYALMDSEKDLRRFLLVQALMAAVVASLGVVQAIVGLDFLNPRQAPEALGLLYLVRRAPLSDLPVPRTTSVFVSDGRFAWYLFIMFVLMLGSSAYFYFSPRNRRALLIYAALGIVVAAIVTSGVRTVIVASIATFFVFWGTLMRQKGRTFRPRLLRMIPQVSLAVGAILLVLVSIFPTKVSAYWAFYTETLLPGSPKSELVRRSFQYPLGNFLAAFSFPHWYIGEGIGTTSLGVKYIVAFFNVPTLGGWVENGFGTLVVEMGPLGLLLWLGWTLSLVYHGWRAYRHLRGSPLWPLGFAIWWYIFIALFPKMWMGMQAYQNYINNAYLWLLTGILFRLPSLGGHSVGISRAESDCMTVR